MIKILARIPDDNGKVIRFSNTARMTVGPEPCDGCQAPAAYVIKGETDSYGFEPVVLCSSCYAKMVKQDEEYMTAADVEDRPGWFIVSECTNYDGHGSWFRAFTSFRSAEAFLRRIEEKAAPWMGLYPGNGVQELATEGEWRKCIKEEREASEAEMKWEMEERERERQKEEEEREWERQKEEARRSLDVEQ